jgi:HprK-related kinase A
VKLSTLSKNSLAHLLKHSGCKFKVSAFNVCLSTPIDTVADHLLRFYGAFELLDEHQFIDFNVSVAAPNPLRRWLRPQVVFSFDGYLPFKPLPYSHASALFEWGLNWCVASQSQQFLIVHAAVAEYNGQAFIFPGTPGSGKSTLCAALVYSGWRLLSDEMALISLADGLVYPVPRPISLKNQSLEVIKQFAPHAVMGSIVPDTSKGTVGHLRPPDRSVELGTTPARPAKLIFPKYQRGSTTTLTPVSKARGFIKAAENCFNYSVLGADGFNSLGRLCEAVDSYDFSYSELDQAIALFTELAQ